MNKLTNFHEKCIRNGVKYKLAYKYKSKHKELTEDEIVNKYKTKSNKELTLEDYCEAAEVDINDVKEFIYDTIDDLADKNPEALLTMTSADWVVGYVNTQRNQSIEDICKILQNSGFDITVPRFKGIQRQHPDWTKDDIISYCILNKSRQPNKIYHITVSNKQYTLSGLCKILKLNYNSIRKVVIENDKVNIDKLLTISNKLYINMLGQLNFVDDTILNTNKQSEKEELTLKELCELNNINYRTATQFKRRHNNIDDKLVIKALVHPEKLTIKDKCDIAGINNREIYHYLEYHKGVTSDQAIRAIKKRKVIYNNG